MMVLKFNPGSSVTAAHTVSNLNVEYLMENYSNS